MLIILAQEPKRDKTEVEALEQEVLETQESFEKNLQILHTIIDVLEQTGQFDSEKFVESFVDSAFDYFKAVSRLAEYKEQHNG